MTVPELYQLFSSPDARYRGKPFWAWNGKLDKDELLRQVHVMQQMGFGGFFMHSRVGLATEYLGDEWFRLIGSTCELARELRMEVWLYDEESFPSGLIGGRITADPEARSKFVDLTERTVTGPGRRAGPEGGSAGSGSPSKMTSSYGSNPARVKMPSLSRSPAALTDLKATKGEAPFSAILSSRALRRMVTPSRSIRTVPSSMSQRTSSQCSGRSSKSFKAGDWIG